MKGRRESGRKAHIEVLGKKREVLARLKTDLKAAEEVARHNEDSLPPHLYVRIQLNICLILFSYFYVAKSQRALED